MSLLREIMGRLRGRLSQRDARGPRAADSSPPSSGDLANYRERLATAADPELLYEWEWLEQRLAILPPAAAADRQRLLAWRGALTAAFETRALSPIRPPAAVDPARHAWELTDPALRQAWRLG